MLVLCIVNNFNNDIFFQICKSPKETKIHMDPNMIIRIELAKLELMKQEEKRSKYNAMS